MSTEYIRTLGSVLRKPLVMHHSPIHIQLEPTTYCNLDCKMCQRSKYITTPTHLNVENFTVILDNVRPKKITFSGEGEPFMNPRLIEMIRLAKERRISINTTSNCTLFTPELCEQIVHSGLDLIKISIDGTTRDTYLRIRGEDKFYDVLQGIRALHDAKKRLQSRTPFLRLNYVIVQENYRELAAMVELANRLNVDAIYFQPLELTDIEERQEGLVGDLTYDSLLVEINRARKVSHQYPQLHTNLSLLSQRLSVYWNKYELKTARHNSRKCILPWFSAYITVDGTIRPCCSFPNNSSADMGNIFQTEIMDIWNNKKYQSFRKAIRAGHRPYNICANCVPQTLTDMVRFAGILPGFLR